MQQLWQNLTTDGHIRWLKYSFSKWGTANTMAVRLDNRSWLVISPPILPSIALVDSLSKDGGVSALLAPNGYHHLGQKAWRTLFPTAHSYAPQKALSRLKIKSPEVHYLDLESLKANLPARIELFLPDGMKAPDVMVRAHSGGETVWFTGDLISNISPEDLALPMRMMMMLFGGSRGFRINKAPSFVYLEDQTLWQQSVLKAMEQHPPKIVLPAHGNPVAENALGKATSILRVAS